jgi:hypothetical protein
LITEESKEIAYVDSFVLAAPKNHTGKPPWIAHESREGAIESTRTFWPTRASAAT